MAFEWLMQWRQLVRIEALADATKERLGRLERWQKIRQIWPIVDVLALFDHIVRQEWSLISLGDQRRLEKAAACTCTISHGWCYVAKGGSR